MYLEGIEELDVWKDTAFSEHDLVSMFIEQLKSIQTNVVWITPTCQKLKLENN